jgi:hypothetical protein
MRETISIYENSCNRDAVPLSSFIFSGKLLKLPFYGIGGLRHEYERVAVRAEGLCRQINISNRRAGN